MKNRKNVSKLEIKHSLEDSLKKNENALDCVKIWINKCEDILKYNEDDIVVKNGLVQLKYIEFCLVYLDDTYSKAYKKVGGKI